MLFDKLFSKYPEIRPNGVLHVGANKGQELNAYREIGVKKMVFIEAIPWIYEELVKNVAGLGDAIALQACVGDVDGKVVTFNIASNEGQSSSMLTPKTHIHEHPQVTFDSTIELVTIRLDTLLCRYETIDVISGLDFLNIDIQGAELLAIKGLGDLLDQFSWVYVEVNRAELYENCAKVWEIDKYLADYGFVGVEEHWTGHQWGDKLYIKQAVDQASVGG